MRNYLLIGLLLLTACGGSLSDEQRKKLREGQANQEIRRVTEAEILEAAFKKGREIMTALEGRNFDSTAIREIEKEEKVSVRWMDPQNPNAPDIEKFLLEAYLDGTANKDSLSDNVQKIGDDSLLYTKPVTKELPEKVLQFEGTWGVHISKKQLILSMDED